MRRVAEEGGRNMAYIDGFVLPLHPDNVDAYKPHAEIFAREARKLGGISIEAIGDGLEPGTLTSFPRSVHAVEGENVVFAFVIWPDKESRDRGWEQIMANPDLQPGPDMPFDGKRMYWGGFKPIVGEEALKAFLAHANG
jgi:uncharacterized protein YbaA (DUF1428 family)